MHQFSSGLGSVHIAAVFCTRAMRVAVATASLLVVVAVVCWHLPRTLFNVYSVPRLTLRYLSLPYLILPYLTLRWVDNDADD